MSFTLSANVTAGKAGGSTPLYLLELHSLSTTYRFGTSGTADVGGWSGVEFTGGRIAENGLGNITNQCDITFGGNVSTISEFNFKLINTDLWALTLVNGGEIFENGVVELRLIYSDKTAPSWANADPRFYGYVDSWYWDESFVYFKCKSRVIKEKELPSRLLTKEEFTNIPDENNGVPAPLIYGDFTLDSGVNKSGIASNISPGGSEVIHRDYVRGMFLSPIQSINNLNSPDNNPRTVWASHDLHTPVLAYQDLWKFYWDSTHKCWGRRAVQFDGTEAFGAFVSGLSTQATFTTDSVGYVYPELIPIIDSVNSSSATNLIYAVDEDDSNYTTLDANGEIASYEMPAGFGKGSGGGLVYCYFRVDTVNRSDDTCQIEITDESGSAVYAFTNIAGYGSFQYVDITSLIVNEGDVTGIRIRFKYVDVTGHDASCEMRIRSVFLRLREKLEIPGDYIYTTVKGRKYGDWIDEAPHTCAYNEDDLIENPAFTVESLIEHELAVDISERLVYESGNVSHGFDRVGLQRDLWKLARQVLDQENSRELIRQIAYEFGFAYFERRNGDICVARIDPLGNPATITSADVLSNNNKSSLSVKRVEARDMKNEFVLKYKQNNATGDYEEILYVKSPNEAVYNALYTNLDSSGETYWDICRAAYNDYSVVNKWEFEAKWIRTKATAEMFLKMMIKKLTRRPYIVEFESSLNLCDIELMDVRRIVHRLVPTAPDRSADNFEDGYRFNYNSVLDDTTANGTHYRCMKQVEDPTKKTIKHTFLDVGLYEELAPDYVIPNYETDGSVTYITPTLILDADDLISSVNEGADVTLWTDKSANAFAFAEATKPPALAMGLFNGHAGVNFVGDNYLESSTAVLSDLIDGGTATVFIVCIVDTITSDDATISSNEAMLSDKTSSNFGVFLKATSSRAHYLNNDGTEDTSYIAVKTASPTLLTCLHDASNNLKIIQEKGDGEISGSGTSGTTAALTNKIILGANADKSKAFDGKIGFMLVYDKALTDSQQAVICDCLKTKYSIY